MTPQRIQRKRTKGWRRPPNTVIVDRTSRWGNPFRIGHPIGLHGWPASKDDVIRFFEQALRAGELPFTIDDVRRELRSKDLACFCATWAPCHADVLLEIANG